jgi:hypothetical protein
MIVVEAGHAHVMKFLPLSCELSTFLKLTIESKNIELFCTQFNSYVCFSFYAYLNYNHL